jgi:predicted metal-dependent hydrolase
MAQSQTPYHTTIRIDHQLVPVRVFRERRRSIRFSVGKAHLLLRLPWILTQIEEQHQLQRLELWAAAQFQRHPALAQRFLAKPYQTGDTLQVGDRTYTLEVNYADLATHQAQRQGHHLKLSISRKTPAPMVLPAMRQLLSRLVGKHFRPDIVRRVQELNHLHFQQVYKQVRLRYNATNWGSCSSGGNINLSTRLLFAPDPVIDYVIIHELAHLVELNHSEKFWKLVENAMPSFREKEIWLKEHGNTCDF